MQHSRIFLNTQIHLSLHLQGIAKSQKGYLMSLLWHLNSCLFQNFLVNLLINHLDGVPFKPRGLNSSLGRSSFLNSSFQSNLQMSLRQDSYGGKINSVEEGN